MVFFAPFAPWRQTQFPLKHWPCGPFLGHVGQVWLITFVSIQTRLNTLTTSMSIWKRSPSNFETSSKIPTCSVSLHSKKAVHLRQTLSDHAAVLTNISDLAKTAPIGGYFLIFSNGCSQSA